jgi:Mn-dependent DtxR family transcriptional regulator
MPRHDIADYLGLTLETVSRTFTELKEMGAIKLESARRVQLVDKAALNAMGVSFERKLTSRARSRRRPKDR